MATVFICPGSLINGHLISLNQAVAVIDSPFFVCIALNLPSFGCITKTSYRHVPHRMELCDLPKKCHSIFVSHLGKDLSLLHKTIPISRKLRLLQRCYSSTPPNCSHHSMPFSSSQKLRQAQWRLHLRNLVGSRFSRPRSAPCVCVTTQSPVVSY